MRIMALDLGDRWTGIALSDPLGIIATPYKTVATDLLHDFLRSYFAQEKINTVIVGYPVTMRGTHSQQTATVDAQIDALKKAFPHVSWVLQDERLTSVEAQSFSKNFSKEEKLKNHARAAALILTSYLTDLAPEITYEDGDDNGR